MDTDSAPTGSCRKRKRGRQQQSFFCNRLSSASAAAICYGLWCTSVTASSSSSSGSAPGTVSPSSEEWWRQPPPAFQASSDDDDSSSDWEWPDHDDVIPLSLTQASNLSAEAKSSGMIATSVETQKKDMMENEPSTEETRAATRKLVEPESLQMTPNVIAPEIASVPNKSNEHSKRPNPSSSGQMLSNTSSSESNPPPNKPLQTLEKLQQMLDETDYLTTSSRRANLIKEFTTDDEATAAGDEYDAISGTTNADDGAIDPPPPSLWTSKDRSKYKRQQRNARTTTSSSAITSQKSSKPPPPPSSSVPPPPRPQVISPERIYEFSYPSPPALSDPNRRTTPWPNPSTLESALFSDVEDPSDTDDGLGYTLPNLPVYLSDDEGDSAMTDAGTTMQGSSSSTGAAEEAVAATSLQRQLRQQPTQPHSPPMILKHDQQIPPTGMYYPSYSYLNAPPPRWYGSPLPPEESPYGYYPPPPPPMTPQQLRQYYIQQAEIASWMTQQQRQQRGPIPHFYPSPYVPRVEGSVGKSSVRASATPTRLPHEVQVPTHTYPATTVINTPQLVPPSSESRISPSKHFRLTFDSVVKLATCLALATVVCYAAVSPHTLPFLEYNQQFYQNLRVAALTTLAPMVVAAFVVDPAENHLSRLVSAFYYAFTIGYCLTFALELFAATVTRLAVFAWWEPNVFLMTPEVPLLVIPWVLREQKYLVKPITLIIQDLVTSAVVCPVMEEWIKLVIFQRTIPLVRNFQWVSKPSKKNPRKSKRVAEPIVPAASISSDMDGDDLWPLQTPGQVVNVNQYVSGMLAVSLGLKLADAVRRVCMYTKAADGNKGFYALFRGVFPIQELCGTVTALSLARRDVLGQKMPLWKLLLPAAIIHGMANFRGMKPVFKWNSATPWSEMQLSPNFMADGASLAQLAAKAFPKVMWLIILMRVTGYCVKNYYMINRQAVKRTTTYAGKHAAFSAELAAAEMLKSSKNNKDKPTSAGKKP